MSVRQNGAVIAGGGTKDMLTQKNITNCITEIPQDIKLELNNGTLTLKAGSKVYVPNGAGVFNEITIASDLTITFTANGQQVVFVNSNGLGLQHRPIYYCNSGTSDTGSGTTFYNTNTNIITSHKSDGDIQVSFPIGIVTVSLGVPTSIQQVFNGFGYIGSTVFALPGVKGLIPNGRNSDGTLSNEDITTTSVITITGAWGSFDYGLYIRYNSSDVVTINGSTLNQCSYDESKNKNVVASNEYRGVYFSHIRTSSDKISRFTPHTAFHAVDYSDGEYIAHQAMPSDKYINLTLGSSGTSYTAPADGYVCFYMSQPSEHWLQVYLSNETARLRVRTYQNTNDIACWLPVSKGDIFYLEYTYNSGSYQFRFIYAQGAQ